MSNSTEATEWRRKVIAIEALATALDPIHQGGETTGTATSELRREKVVVGGTVDYLPVISANSLAHHMRENCVYWTLDQIGFERFGVSGERAFKLLFAGGGRATKIGTASYIDLREEHELRSLFPTVSLFGGTIGNRMEKGRVRVESIVPVCQETAARLPDWLQAEAQKLSIADLLDEQSFTTADPRENTDYRDYLDPVVVNDYRRGQEARLKKNESGSDMKMRHTVECLAAGSEFYIGFLLRYPTPVEVGVFLGGLSYFASMPFIGGKTNRGFGRIQFEPRQFELVRFTRVEGPLAGQTMQIASEHLARHAAQIKQIIQDGAL